MKYLLLIFALILSLNFGNRQIVFAQEKYARAINSTNLYKLTSNNELGNVICIVEKTYFVQILSANMLFIYLLQEPIMFSILKALNWGIGYNAIFVSSVLFITTLTISLCCIHLKRLLFKKKIV